MTLTYLHPNQAAAYVDGLERELEMAKASGNKAYVAEVQASLKEARLVSTAPLPLGERELDHKAERDWQLSLDETRVGRPPPATPAEKTEAYIAALKVDLAAKKGTPHEAHVKTELARAERDLAATRHLRLLDGGAGQESKENAGS